MKSPRKRALKNILVGHVILPTLLLWGVAVAADTSLSEIDRRFISETAATGAAEVELGRLAQQKGSEEDVREFGAKLAEEHTELNAALRTLADAKQVKLEAEPDAMQRRQIEELRQLSGREFDDRFANLMIVQHENAVRSFREAGSNAEDSDVKRFAAEHLPILQAHLQHAKNLE